MDNAPTVESVRAAKQGKRRPPFVDFVARLAKEKPLGTFGAVIVFIFLLTAILANFIAPYGENEIHTQDRLLPPSMKYLLGTDNVGRDLLTRIIYGARISMFVGLGAAALDALGAMLIGIISGYMGGKTDLIIQRFVDAWMCFPGLVIFMTVISLVGPGLLQIILVLGISSSIAGSRIIRGATIAIKRDVYVQASVATGSPTWWILFRHILPNVMAPLIVIFTLSVGSMIIAEASLSFLGFGIPPPVPSWGGMLSGSGRTYMSKAPGMAVWPGLALSVVVYGMNMFGDALRDLLDPRLRGGLGRYSGVKRRKINMKKGIGRVSS